MTDTQRIQALEGQLAEVQSELGRLTLALNQLASTAESRRESIQAGVDDLQNSVQLIFKHVHVPDVIYKPGKRILID